MEVLTINETQINRTTLVEAIITFRHGKVDDLAEQLGRKIH